MKRLLFAAALIMTLSAHAKYRTADEVKDIIRRVNTFWQTNNPAEVRSFWDNAAYHTGNIEVYKLLHDERMLDYSIRWAEHNRWMGATGADPSGWKYKTYGEGPDFVLFGDWQTCFQTYIDLYNIAPDERKVARAREVMGYMADSKADDYWWWADALYMVMPVMTKMYKLTGEEKYLDKLYENLRYSDSIMLDPETGLYFRDGRYVWPEHKSANGRKDFWARGDGYAGELPSPCLLRGEIPQNGPHGGRTAAAGGLLDPLADGSRPCSRPGDFRYGVLLLWTSLGGEQRIPLLKGVWSRDRKGLEIPRRNRPAEERQGRLCAAHRRPGHTRAED